MCISYLHHAPLISGTLKPSGSPCGVTGMQWPSCTRHITNHIGSLLFYAGHGQAAPNRLTIEATKYLDEVIVDLSSFNPLIRRWFTDRFAEPTAPQSQGWAHIAEGRDTLIAAPTGSGKTLAAFLWSINHLIDVAQRGKLTDETHVIYVSPLKALGNDIQKNLQDPLADLRQLAEAQGTPLPEIRVMVRSGDTPARERNLMARKPPHILITTPESLYILLTAERSRNFCRSAQAVIVDEIHAVAGDKRGSHLALSLERLDLLAGRRLQRIGLSATINPVAEVAQLLVGADRTTADNQPRCAIVNIG